MSDLFSQPGPDPSAPLAHRLRPRTFEEYVGQSHLIGPGKFLTEIIKSPSLPSLIFWGPPGSGKTTLAHLLSQKKDYRFISISAVTSGIKDLKEIVGKAEEDLKYYHRKTLLFIDEIHRFNKAQQDALLPHVETGTLTLIGATTENPSFEVIHALLSRCRVLVLKRLTEEELRSILRTALTESERGLGSSGLAIDQAAENFLIHASDGDARRLLNTLDVAAQLALMEPETPGKPRTISLSHAEASLQKKMLGYDKKGEEHYNVISAFIKSMRGSDPDAAVYYLARLFEAGEDPLFIARRMVIFASEDIGNADPQAIQVAMACMQSYDFIGLAEGWIPLSQCATYLASAPKSNASYMAYKQARADVEEHGTLPVPMHLRNAPTKMMKEMGYGKGYQYAHNAEDHIVNQQHLPDELKGKKYYVPTEIGYEKKIREWLEKVAAKKA